MGQMPEQLDSRREKILEAKAKIKQLFEDEVARRVKSGNFLKRGTQEPALKLEDFDRIPDDYWELLVDIASGIVAREELVRRFQRLGAEAAQQFAEAKREAGKPLSVGDHYIFVFREYVANEISKIPRDR